MIAGSSGSVSIPAAKLGLGKVKIQAVGLVSNAVHFLASGLPSPVAGAAAPTAAVLNPAEFCLAAPLEIEIAAPRPLVAIADQPQLSPGLLLVPDGLPGVVVDSTAERDWLAKRVGAGQGFTLEGFFNAPTAEMYQVQARTSIGLEVSVDGQLLGQAANGRLAYLPVSLEAGLHRLSIKGRASAKPAVELLFGGPGAQSLGRDRFQHAAAAKTN